MKNLRIDDSIHGISYNSNNNKNYNIYEGGSDYFHVEIPQPYSKLNIVCGLVTIYFLYLKFIDSLMVSWQACFYINYAMLIARFITSFIEIIRDNTKEIKEIIANKEFNDKRDILSKIESLILLNNLINLINYTLVFFIMYFYAELMDSKNDINIFYCLSSVSALLLNQLLFSILATSNYFNIQSNRKMTIYDEESNTLISGKERENNINNINKTTSSFYDSIIAFIVSLLTPALTYISNMTIICSANSGVCTQFYLSTFTSLLGAFGITISNISDYLLPITIVMLIVSNISLYIKKKKLTHPPFLLGLLSTSLIILGELYKDDLMYMLYIGNVLMIVAALWNMKINKFFGIPIKWKF